MIVANVRRQLARSDAQLAIRLIGRGSDHARDGAEHALREEGIDALLDDPRLMEALLESPQGARASLALFTYVIVRHALRAEGEHDRTIADYVAAVLLEFGKRDRANRVSATDDEIYRTCAELLSAADGPDPRRSLRVRAHLGNYALWLSGVFPDFIEHRRWRRGGPDLEYFEEIGRRGYQLAAEHRLANEHGLHLLYAAVADRFAVLRLALNDVSDRLLFPNHNTPERLMRQVHSEMRIRRWTQ